MLSSAFFISTGSTKNLHLYSRHGCLDVYEAEADRFLRYTAVTTPRFLGGLRTDHILRSVNHDLAQNDAKDAPPPVLDAGGLDVNVPEGSDDKCPITDMQLYTNR